MVEAYTAVPNFQCPECGKMSVVEGYFDIYGSPVRPPPLPDKAYRYKCLSCGFLFAPIW